MTYSSIVRTSITTTTTTTTTTISSPTNSVSISYTNSNTTFTNSITSLVKDSLGMYCIDNRSKIALLDHLPCIKESLRVAPFAGYTILECFDQPFNGSILHKWYVITDKTTQCYYNIAEKSKAVKNLIKDGYKLIPCLKAKDIPQW